MAMRILGNQSPPKHHRKCTHWSCFIPRCRVWRRSMDLWKAQIDEQIKDIRYTEVDEA